MHDVLSCPQQSDIPYTCRFAALLAAFYVVLSSVAFKNSIPRARYASVSCDGACTVRYWLQAIVVVTSVRRFEMLVVKRVQIAPLPVAWCTDMTQGLSRGPRAWAARFPLAACPSRFARSVALLVLLYFHSATVQGRYLAFYRGHIFVI